MASGKSVKSRTHHSHVVVWLRVCSLNVNFRILRLSMAGFAKFHNNCESCILWHQLFTLWLAFICSEFWKITGLLSKGRWAHKFSKNLGATAKFYVPKGWYEASSHPVSQQICYSTNIVTVTTLCFICAPCAVMCTCVCTLMGTVVSVSRSQTLSLSVCQYSKISLSQAPL